MMELFPDHKERTVADLCATIEMLRAELAEVERQRDALAAFAEDIAEQDCCEHSFPQQFRAGRCDHCRAIAAFNAGKE